MVMKGASLTSHKQVVEAYIEGFRRTDHEAIRACLADDIVWVLHGYRTLEGKEAFDAEIDNDAAVGSIRAERAITNAMRPSIGSTHAARTSPVPMGAPARISGTTAMNTPMRMFDLP
jgi:hypothetical protein